MQIRIFEDRGLLNRISMNMTNLERRTFKVLTNETAKIENFLKTWENSRDRDSLTGSLGKNRSYFSIFGARHDSHFIQEMLALNEKSNKYYYIVSLEDSLDLILNHVCGCDPNRVRIMNSYSKVSRSLLSLDINNLDIKLSEFEGLDSNLDSYLMKGLIDDEVNYLSDLLTTLCGSCYRMLIYIAFYLESACGLSVKSVGRGKVLLGSNAKWEETQLEIVNNNLECNYRLLVNSYNREDLPEEQFEYGVIL